MTLEVTMAAYSLIKTALLTTCTCIHLQCSTVRVTMVGNRSGQRSHVLSQQHEQRYQWTGRCGDL